MANIFAELAGKLCEVLLPVKHDIFYGNGQSGVAICTLSSIDLLELISKSDIMQSVALAARLFSENRGIETLVRHVLQHPSLRHIVLCGRDARGHLPGQALLALHRNGIDSNGRIIGAPRKDPVVNLSEDEVNIFRKQVDLIDLINVTDMDEISGKVLSLSRA